MVLIIGLTLFAMAIVFIGGGFFCPCVWRMVRLKIA